MAAKKAGTSSVGKRMSGGSFDTGPSTPVKGMTKEQSRRGRLSRFGTGSARGSKVAKRDYDTDERKKLADKGDAMPGGRFPIKTKRDLANAKHDLGRSKNPAAARRFIDRRAKQLGAAPVGKAALWTPTPVLSRSAPITPAAPAGPGGSPVSSAAGGQMKPGMLVPSPGTPIANVAGRAAGGQKSGSIPASGKLKPATTLGTVGTQAAAQPTKSIGKAYRPMMFDEFKRGLKSPFVQVAGIAGGATLAGEQGKKVIRRHREAQIGKAFNAERDRQRRLGAYQASAGIAGAGGAATAAHEALRLKRSGARVVKLPKGAKGIPLTRRAAAGAAVGVAGAIGERKIRRYAQSGHNQEWR